MQGGFGRDRPAMPVNAKDGIAICRQLGDIALLEVDKRIGNGLQREGV